MKETHYKLKHRVTALFAAAVMLCSMLPGAAFAEEPTPQPTEETVQMEQQTEPSETDNGQTDESSPDPGEDEIKEYLAGNLCRCSGYEGQLRGILNFLAWKKGKEAAQ